MSLRERCVGLTVVALIALAAASAEPRPSPFRTAQITGPSSPEPPLADGAKPPPGPALPTPVAPCPVEAPAPVVAPPGTACPVDPPTPTVAIHVRAPASAAAGEEVEYRLLVENTSRAPAHHVLVRNPLPEHARFVRATPKPDQTEGDLLWRLGTLDACARREIVLVLSPTGTGDVNDCARVQFEHGQCVTTRVTRPQLAVRQAGPAEATVGEALTFRVTVTNAGAAEATGVALVVKLQAGWQLGDAPFEKGKETERRWSLDALAPGQSRTVEYQATPREAGRLCTSAQATAAGGLVSEPARHCVTVGQREMTLNIEGPRTAYARRPVNFFLTVKNTGTLPAADVVVTDTLPEGLEFVQANQGGRHRDGQVRWDLGTLPPGQSRILQLRVQSDAEREVRQKAVAAYGPGLEASGEIATKFQGAAGFDFDVTADAYAVEVDTPVRYTVTVFNRGSGAQTNVRVVIELPPQLQFKEAKAPDGVKYREEKGVVTFDPLATLPAGAPDAVYEVVAVARAVGDARVQASMRAGAAERSTVKPVLTQIGEKQPP